MKPIFTLIFFQLSILSYGQTKFDGLYCSSNNIATHCISLTEDSLFEYNWSGCMNKLKGKGTYKINKKNIILNFISVDTLTNSFQLKEVSNCDTNDYLTINFFSIDKESYDTISFVTVLLTNLSGELVAAQQTNIYGIATFKIPKSKEAYIIKAHFTGYKDFSISGILADKCKDLTVKFAYGDNSIIENGTQFKYEFRTNRKKQIISLENKDGLVLWKIRE